MSIVGAFIAFPLFGFSINTICLMGLVLAIGLVVDDAIVVVEAVIEPSVQRRKAPARPAIAAVKEVSGPVRQHGAGDFLRLYPHAAAAPASQANCLNSSP